MEYPQVQALFSHPNLKAITLQQPLADAMILGKKKVRVLGRFVIHAHCLRTSAGGWWCGQPPAATRPTVFKNALGHKSLGEGWLAADPVPARVYHPPPSSCVLGAGTRCAACCRNTVRRRRHQHRLSLAAARRRFITLLRAAVC